VSRRRHVNQPVGIRLIGRCRYFFTHRNVQTGCAGPPSYRAKRCAVQRTPHFHQECVELYLHSTMRLSSERWHSTYEIQPQASWPNYTPAEVKISNCLWDSTRFLSHHYRGYCVGRSVGRATRYGLNDPGIESRWRRNFLILSRPALWPAQPTIQCVLGLTPGVKADGA